MAWRDQPKPVGSKHSTGALPPSLKSRDSHITETGRMDSVSFNMQNRAFGSYSVTVHGILIPVMHSARQGLSMGFKPRHH
jgi:hypothetical protein